MMLFTGITILCDINLCAEYCDYVEGLLCSFVEHFGSVYGQETMIYNMHGLIHLPEQSRRFGPLHNFSGFPFENYLQKIKKLIRKPEFPLQQAVRRLAEKMHLTPPLNILEIICKKEHRRGPLPHNIAVFEQYEQIYMTKFMLSIRRPDNAILVGENTYLVKNILCQGDDRQCVCQRFRHRESYFTYPFDSLKINISLVSGLSEHLETFDVSKLVTKVVLLPLKDKFVSIPMI